MDKNIIIKIENMTFAYKREEQLDSICAVDHVNIHSW